MPTVCESSVLPCEGTEREHVAQFIEVEVGISAGEVHFIIVACWNVNAGGLWMYLSHFSVSSRSKRPKALGNEEVQDPEDNVTFFY